MNNKETVKTTILLTIEQRDFLKNSSYSFSKLFRNTVAELMKKNAQLK